jgi:hypothetical protein
MPDSISTTRHPVGIIIQHGLSRTTSTRFWAFVWSTREHSDGEAWRRSAGEGWEDHDDRGDLLD